jgi:hypothetical protein
MNYLKRKKYLNIYSLFLIKFFFQAVFEQFRKDDIRIIEMSTFSEEGVIEVRNEVNNPPIFILINQKNSFLLGLRSFISTSC